MWTGAGAENFCFRFCCFQHYSISKVHKHPGYIQDFIIALVKYIANSRTWIPQLEARAAEKDRDDKRTALKA